MPLPQITSEGQLDSAIKDHASTVIIFSAVWSSVGQETLRKFEQAGSRYPAVYQAWISTDENQDLAEKYGINSIPATIGFKGGSEVARYIGPQLSENQAEGFIKRVL